MNGDVNIDKVKQATFFLLIYLHLTFSLKFTYPLSGQHHLREVQNLKNKIHRFTGNLPQNATEIARFLKKLLNLSFSKCFFFENLDFSESVKVGNMLYNWHQIRIFP